MSGNLKGSGGNVTPFSECSLDWKKAVSACFLTGTHIVCPTAGYVLAVNICSDATGPASICVHDGHNITGRRVWFDQALGNHAHGSFIATPIYCDIGITIIVAAATYASIQWLPGPRLK